MSIDDQLKIKDISDTPILEAETCLKPILTDAPENHDARLGYALVLLMLSRPESPGHTQAS